MDDNQPTTAREYLHNLRMSEKGLHEQSVHDGSDYDYILVGNGIKIPIGSRNIDGMNTAISTDQWFNESVRFEDHITK